MSCSKCDSLDSIVESPMLQLFCLNVDIAKYYPGHFPAGERWELPTFVTFLQRMIFPSPAFVTFLQSILSSRGQRCYSPAQIKGQFQTNETNERSTIAVQQTLQLF